MRNIYFHILILVLATGVGAFFVSAQTFTSPTTAPVSGNVEGPLTTSSTGEYKRGTLGIGKTSNATTGSILDVVGNIRARGLSVLGAFFVEGNITTDSLQGSSTVSVCADGDGVLAPCSAQYNPQTITLVNEDTPGSYKVKVPPGVSEVTVEIWGAGGPGYYYANTNASSGFFGCAGTAHIFRSGGSSFVGMNITMTASAGKCGYKSGNSYIGGAGGAATATGSLIKSGSSVTASGANGNNGSSGASASVVNCNADSRYDITYGGQGGSGGAGGSASNGGAGGSAGSGSAGGTSSQFVSRVSDCNDIYGISSGVGPFSASAGGNGLNGSVPGGGGGGAGGNGGDSSVEFDGSGCQTGCNGTSGYSGGGAGGYAKATLTGLNGNEFDFTVGGAYKNNAMNICIGCTHKSGWGAHGRVKVTYIQ